MITKACKESLEANGYVNNLAFGGDLTGGQIYQNIKVSTKKLLFVVYNNHF